MILTGIGDEAANTIDGQIRATQELGWKHLEPRNVEVPGFTKANFHDIPDPAFDLAVKRLENSGIGVYCFGSTIMNWAKKIDDPFEITLSEVKRAIPRMKRVGAKNKPVFRIVVADGRSPRDGKFIEEIGTYLPRKKGDNFSLDLDRAKYWLGQAVIRFLRPIGLGNRGRTQFVGQVAIGQAALPRLPQPTRADATECSVLRLKVSGVP